MIQLLVDHGADVWARNNDGETALELVEKKDAPEERVGVDPTEEVEDTPTKEEVAAVLRQLMNLGPDEAVPPPPDAAEPGDDTEAESAESEVGA
jgi:hypothetical protein